MRASRVALAAVLIAFPACSLLVDTRCFEGECADGSLGADGGADVLDAPVDVDPCAFPADADPCANVFDGYGGCYCGSSTQSGFDPSHATASCLYRCNDKTAVHYTDKTHHCASGCAVASAGTADYCIGQPCSGDAAYCNVYCGGP